MGPRAPGARLVLAFVGVALAAEAVFASVTLLTTRSDLAGLATTQRSNTTTAVVSALRNAYEAKGGWSGADIKPALTLVHFWGAALEVVSPKGATLFSAGPVAMLRSGDPIGEHLPLTVDGHEIGDLHLVFPKGGLTPGDRRLRSDLGGAVEISAVIAAAVALLVAVVVAKGLVRPIRRLSEAAQALGSGTKGIRVGEQTGPVSWSSWPAPLIPWLPRSNTTSIFAKPWWLTWRTNYALRWPSSRLRQKRW